MCIDRLYYDINIMTNPKIESKRDIGLSQYFRIEYKNTVKKSKLNIPSSSMLRK